MNEQIKYIGEMEKLTLGDNDVLVLSTLEVLPQDAALRLRESLEATFPGRTVIVLSGGMKLGVMEREAA